MKTNLLNINLFIAVLLFAISCKDVTDIIEDDDPINNEITANCEVIKDGMTQSYWERLGPSHPILREEIQRISKDLYVPVPDTDEWNPEATIRKYEMLLERIGSCDNIIVEDLCFACEKYRRGLSVFSISMRVLTASGDSEIITKYVTMKTDILGSPIYVVDISLNNHLEDDGNMVEANCDILVEAVSTLTRENPNNNIREELKRELNRLAYDLPVSFNRDINPDWHRNNFSIFLERIEACSDIKIAKVCFACPEDRGNNSLFTMQLNTSTGLLGEKLFVLMQTASQNEKIKVLFLDNENPFEKEGLEPDCRAISTVLYETNITIYPPEYVVAINKLAEDLIPQSIPNDEYGHSYNLQTLVDRINNCTNLKAEVDCYNCLKSMPPKSQITIYGIINGQKAYAQVLLNTGSDLITVAGLGKTSYNDDENENGEFGKEECDKIVQTALDDLKLMAPSNIKLLRNLLNKYLSEMKPMVTNDDKYGHRRNLNNFVERLNSCENIKSELDCYACMESFPPKSNLIIKIYTEDTKDAIKVLVNILTDPNNVMTVSSIKYE